MAEELFGGQDVGATPSYKEQAYRLIKEAILFNRFRVGAIYSQDDICKELGIKMMYISTDYVFDGQGTTPWDPDCKDYQPLNVYGQSKLGGELAVSGALEKYFIVRIAWVFGLNGSNFIKTMLKLSETHDTLRVVCDQIGTPTYTYDLSTRASSRRTASRRCPTGRMPSRGT